MWKYDWKETTVLALLLALALNTGLIAWFGFDAITKLMPIYAGYIYKGFGLLAAIVIYFLYKQG